MVPVLLCQVSHGAIQFTAYEELRKVVACYKSNKGKADHTDEDKILVSVQKPLPFKVPLKGFCDNASVI